VKAIVYVLIGGALGSLLRYLMGMAIKPAVANAFPLHTFLVNSIGCICIGMAAAFIEKNGANNVISYLVIAGILGGFTTFSGYAIETLTLFQQKEIAKALLYIFASNILGILSAVVGYMGIKQLV
jgi:fluoride exporter